MTCRFSLLPWVLVAAVFAAEAAAQDPELPIASPPTDVGTPESAPSAAIEGDDGSSVAEASGPIAVEASVPDDRIARRLRRLLPRYPGVRTIEVEVEEGVVTLNGHVEDDRARDRLRDFVRRVQGVSLVINRTRTDAQVLTAWKLLAKRLGGVWTAVSKNWLSTLMALLVVAATIGLTRVYARWSDRLLAPIFESVLLRSVVGSLVGLLILLLGLYAALEALGVARAVLSVVGLAGAVALAISFAFRDFAENFIASLLLGVRRPFRVGDYVKVADHEGAVRAMTTRATVLVTLEGHQVRIPNSIIFKNVLVNTTASDAVRDGFDVVIGYDESVVAAQRAIAGALAGHDGILDEPPPRVLVQALEAEGVRLRAAFWMPARGVDSLKILSDARLKAKVALQELGIRPVPPPSPIIRLDAVPAADRDGEEGRAERPSGSTVSPRAAFENHRQDAEVAAAATRSGDAQGDAIDQAMTVARDVVEDNGDDLLSDGPS